MVIHLKKKKWGRSRRHPAETITDANYTGDLALLSNTSAEAECLLRNLEHTARGIGLYVNTVKTR